VSQKEPLAELLSARVDTRQKREAMRQARADYEAAKKHLDELFDEVEAGQGRLAFDPRAKPKKPSNGDVGDKPKSDAG
jgi:hypothetical protein